jgi:short-subunit dehydrogenase
MKKKTILITGSTRGIGKELKSQLEDKYNVIGFGSKECNLASPLSIVSYVEILPKKIDILINNAGVFSTDDNAGVTSRLFPVNSFGPAILTEQLRITKRLNKHSLILNISTSDVKKFVKNQTLYIWSKAALEKFGELFEFENNIKVLNIQLPPVKTDMYIKGYNTKSKPISVEKAAKIIIEKGGL